MSGSNARLATGANENTAARSCGQRTVVRSIPAVMQAARSLWGRGSAEPHRKPDIELAQRMGGGLRSAQYVLAGTKGLKADRLATLLTTDMGPRVFRELTAHMDDATLAAYGREIERARLLKQQDAAARRLESLEREGGA